MKGKYRVSMGAMLSLVPLPWKSVVVVGFRRDAFGSEVATSNGGF